jgi:DNA-binding transcriptional ArsR family regulator
VSHGKERRGDQVSGGTNSAGELLHLVRTGAVATRGELQRVTGLARSTLTYRVDALLAAGYLTEDGSVADPRRGRPSTRLRVNDQAATVLVADLGATHGRLAVATAAGDVINETVIESAIGKGPSTVLDMVTAELDAMLKRSGRSPETLRGVGMGVPGPVD